jgi:hypothetical protein
MMSRNDAKKHTCAHLSFSPTVLPLFTCVSRTRTHAHAQQAVPFLWTRGCMCMRTLFSWLCFHDILLHSYRILTLLWRYASETRSVVVGIVRVQNVHIRLYKSSKRYSRVQRVREGRGCVRVCWTEGERRVGLCNMHQLVLSSSGGRRKGFRMSR